MENLTYNIFGTEITNTQIHLKKNRNIELFYIVEHTNDEDFIKKEAREKLLQAGQTYYHFYGKNEPLWHLLFDEANMELFCNKDSIALTFGYESLSDFVEELELKKSFSPIVACDYYLIYDDKKIYEKVKERILF